MRTRRKAYLSNSVFVFNDTISTFLNYYLLYSRATDAGWNGTAPINATLNVTPSGVILGTSVGFLSPSLPAGSSLTINNQGQIWGGRGVGGAGGSVSGTNGGNGTSGKDAVQIASPVFINNTGTIAGGGGGGGGGGGAYAPGQSGGNDAFAAGGNGGNGEDYSNTQTNGVSGATSNPVGGAIATSGSGGAGSAAGRPGVAGGNGSVTAGGTAGAGGAAGAGGKAIVGGEFVKWINVGTVRGDISYGVTTHIAKPAASPSTGAAFEGGYYTGAMVWQEVATSSTTMTLSSSELWRHMVVPEAAVTPLFYTGQLLEIRSRANPANKFTATVVSAFGENLSVQITGALGSTGSQFSDWSIMARHRLIVAPKATGETSLAIATGVLPSSSWTLIDGAAVTSAMFAAGDSAQFPAAHWAKGLNIGGYSDWYIPSRDELERIWRFLKPISVSNYVTADRPVSPTNSYVNHGSPGDTSASQGINVHGTASTTAYSTGSPGQTTSTIFRTGGAQVMEYGTAVYASCSAYSPTDVWVQSYQTTSPGRQLLQAKETSAYLRAIRKSII